MSRSAEGRGHTPGPWTVTHVAGSNFAVQEFKIRGMFGPTPDTYPIFNKDCFAIDGGSVFCSPQDARLIAAAPDLLEALRAVRLQTSDWTNEEVRDLGLETTLRMVRDALEKAEGRS